MLEYFTDTFQIFFLVFARLMGLFTTAPFFSGAAMPVRVRMALGFFTSLLAVPLVIGLKIIVPADLADYGVKVASNFLTGLGIGFFLNVIIQAFQVSAQVFSLQMGMGMNEVLDPISDTQVPALGNILGILILLLLIRVDGHVYMLQLVMDSFRSVDVLRAATFGLMMKGFLAGIVSMIEIALRIALPIIGITIVLDVAMGILSRVAPQFNVMIMGFNLKLIVGFAAIWLILPALVSLGDGIIRQLIQNAGEWVRMMRPA